VALALCLSPTSLCRRTIEETRFKLKIKKEKKKKKKKETSAHRPYYSSHVKSFEKKKKKKKSLQHLGLGAGLLGSWAVCAVSVKRPLQFYPRRTMLIGEKLYA
jgi:hypothetical protein